MLGGACVAYLWAGGSIFEREPPLLAFGILLIVLGAGLAGGSRAAALLVRAGLGAGLVALGWIATSYLRFRGLGATDDLLARVYLLGIVLAVAGVVALVMLVRRVKYNKRAFRRIDLLLLAGTGVALALGVVWLGGDDWRLCACRRGVGRGWRSVVSACC